MKKYALPAAVLLVLLLLALCCGGRCRSAWYPIEGGYVNLHRVATVRAVGRLALVGDVTTTKKDLLGREKEKSETRELAVLLDGPITAQSVAAAKARLAKAPKWTKAEGGAALHLDRVAAPFARVPAKADAAALSALLDDWLRSAEEVKRRLR